MKKLVSALVLCLLLGVASAALAGGFAVVTRTDSLNLRAQATSSSQWLGSYARGTWVELLGGQNNFFLVRTPDGRTGYMSKNYLRLDVEDGDYHQAAVVDNPAGNGFLNFRAQPGYEAQVLGIFYNAVPLRVRSVQNGWYGVTVNGVNGYVRCEYVVDLGWQFVGDGTVATVKAANGKPVNLRMGPGLQYDVVTQLQPDQYVSVLARGNGWWSVALPYGTTGFISADYVKEGLCAAQDMGGGGSGGTPFALVQNPGVNQALNLRQYPSMASRVLDKLYNGRRLWVNEQGTEWCSVTDEATGLSGYVMTQYVKLNHLPARPEKRVVHPNGTYVNLRTSPDMAVNNVRVRVPSGSTVTVLIPGDDWCKVRWGSHTGYMMRYFLQ